MKRKPTVPEFFLVKYFYPALVEFAQSKLSKQDIFIITQERFETQEGFRLDMCFNSIYRHIKAEKSHHDEYIMPAHGEKYP